MSFEKLTPGGLATQACLLEVSAPKPGNVHRGADFADTTFYDFQTSAVLLGQTIDQTVGGSLGKMVLDCVKANQEAVGKNTNLGMILLICPLAKAFQAGELGPAATESVLSQLTADDCRDVYDAIALASPGGLGKSDEMSVEAASPSCLLSAMKAAENRDLVARQYSTNFATVFEVVMPLLFAARQRQAAHEAIVEAHVQMMAKYPDSLISRKCGIDVAINSQRLAQHCVNELGDQAAFLDRLGELDFWLRSDGNRRNPGTTADLIAAGLFVAMANGNFKA